MPGMTEQFGMQLVAALPTGGFCSPVKLLFVAILAAVWLILALKINDDAITIHTNNQLWSLIYLGAGAFGLMLWVLLPSYWIGLPLFVVLVAGAMAAYIIHRNSLVDPVQRIGAGAMLTGLMVRRSQKVEDIETILRLYDSDSRAVILSDDEATNPQLVHSYNLTQQFLHDVALRRAAEVDLTPDAQQVRVLYNIDGVVHKHQPMPLADADVIIQYVKEKAGLDVEERKVRQKGRIFVDLTNSPMELEVLTIGTPAGQRMQIRVLQELVQTDMDLLGMDESLARTVAKILNEPGLLIVSGPPKSGVTSTLYSLLKKQDAYVKALYSLESRIVVDLENVTQVAYGDPAALGDTLASVLRRDPDMVLVDQCPDAEIARLIREYAAEKLVILGMEARDSFTAMAKWVQLVGDISGALAPLRGVLCQQLMRKLCTSCRQPYQPDATLLAKLHVSSRKQSQFYQPPQHRARDEEGNIIPCQTCQDVAYCGRTGVFELLEINDMLRRSIAGGASLAQIKALAKQNHMLSLQDHAIRKVTDGVTSLQEVVRAGKQPSAGKPAK